MNECGANPSEGEAKISAINEANGLWTLWEAIESLLEPGVSIPLRYGTTGAILVRSSHAITLADFQYLLLPGLHSLGVAAELLDWKAYPPLVVVDSLARRRRNSLVSIFAFEEGDVEEREEPVTDEDTSTRDTRGLSQQGLLSEVSKDQQTVEWRDSAHRLTKDDADKFRATFTHSLTLSRGARRGERRSNLRNALLRWITYYEAYPDRSLTDTPEDTLLRETAAEFLDEASGKQRDYVNLRLHRASQNMRTGKIASALHSLKEAVFREIGLPDAVGRALLAAPETNLTDPERRELIYLARAGTLTLKILSARRLTTERRHPEVDRTLEQLQYDPHPWVRAALSLSYPNLAKPEPNR